MVELAEDLEARLMQAEPGLALRAVQALARLGRLRGEVLRQVLCHSDTEVVKTALTEGQGEELLQLAVGLLRHAEWDVRLAAARVLGERGTLEHLPPVREALTIEADGLVRQALAEAEARLVND